MCCFFFLGIRYAVVGSGIVTDIAVDIGISIGMDIGDGIGIGMDIGVDIDASMKTPRHAIKKKGKRVAASAECG